MSNFFLIDSYGNATVSGNLSVDGYTINPSNSSVGQVLAYDGYSYVPTTISNNTGGTPTISGGSGLSDGYTLMLANATNTSGIIKITQLDTGSPGSATSTIATVNFSNTFETLPNIILAPSNFNAMAAQTSQKGIFLNSASTSTSGFTLTSGREALQSMQNIRIGSSTEVASNSPVTMSWTLGASKSWAQVAIAPSNPSGTLGFESAASATSTGTATLSWSHTVTSASKLLVSVAVNSLSSINSVTWNGSPLVLGVSKTNGTATAAIYFGNAPTSGTHNVVVTLNPNGDNYLQYGTASACSIGMTGSYNDNGTSFVSTSMGIGTAASLVITPAQSSSFIVDCVAVTDGGATLTVGGGQTQRANAVSTGTGYEYDYTYIVT